ncbi:spore germination protein [Halobacillus karajensis]|uniref:Spore germination protein A1 n=1 Tax=Halobacillus karajensis TaxID=195088 RepID=A0A024P7M1_9BACI|nr:spore germination protein [Halobacillus karajensis]CDQ21178.1 Spore germination protein A1 [Halobacillus karajensis]CDQ24758.1 Spore germination protein A1 [Halobacillus karajensis]CDQ28882.1 Spore germination protein A1 [Halobacillus karajensis]
MSTLLPMNKERYMKKSKQLLNESPDLIQKAFKHEEQAIIVQYIAYQVEKEKLEDEVMEIITKSNHKWSNEDLINKIPITSTSQEDNMDRMIQQMIHGSVSIYIEGEKEAVLFALPKQEHRSLNQAETESLVFGPQVSFTESLITNLNVIRWRLDTSDLVVEKLIVGERVQSEVRIVYLKSLANEENVETMRQRIKDLKVAEVEDTSVLGQLIEDSSSTVFPQLIFTELPDRFCNSISKGRVGVMVDKSPTMLIGPMNLFNFFESTEDLYMRWNMGSFIRLLRFVSMALSIILTPMYVAALTFHYEIVPSTLLVSLGQSRATVPFPPVLEALLLEMLIELLREAGARLPTKVGQTMGIVGGIVLGQAAVEAGFTSNILIIIIALSALASFTAPSYLMGTAIRIIRFPMIILAGAYGIIGIVFALSFLVIHLLKQKSLGRPYLSPIYPFQWKDFNESIIRLPFQKNAERSKSMMTKDKDRYSKDKANERKDVDRL